MFYGSGPIIEGLTDCVASTTTSTAETVISSKRNSQIVATDVMELIRLNVGGLRFTFTPELLASFQDSSFARYFLEEGDSIMTDKDVAFGAKIKQLASGEFFYEANGAAFYYTLNFMRSEFANENGEVAKQTLTIREVKDLCLLEEVKQTAQECGIDAFVLILQDRISHLRLEKALGPAYTGSRAVLTITFETLRGLLELLVWLMKVLRITAVNTVGRVEAREWLERFGRGLDGVNAVHVSIQSLLIVASVYVLWEVLG